MVPPCGATSAHAGDDWHFTPAHRAEDLGLNFLPIRVNWIFLHLRIDRHWVPGRDDIGWIHDFLLFAEEGEKQGKLQR